MKKISTWLVLFIIPIMLVAQQQSPIAIVPQPALLMPQNGSFTFTGNILISAPAGAEAQYVADYLKNRLSKATGYPVNASTFNSNAAIQLLLNKSSDTALGKEGYKLSVTPNQIIIRANQAAGLFYGVQTLMQLMPKEVEGDTAANHVSWTVPCVEITDYPRFGWRGLMFDVARHFFTKQEVKDYIDQMVKYKLNLLHLHLTDDEGWRIEIKSLPKLTEVGAWNVKKKVISELFAAHCR